MSTSTYDYEALTWAEVADIGSFLHEIDDAEFDQPSLCEGWAVRDVIGHMSVGHTTPMPQMMALVLKYKFNIPKGSYEMSKAWAKDRSADEVRAFWDKELVEGHARKGIAKTIKWHEAYVDHFIHEQDMRLPLGRPRAVDEDKLLAALDAVPRLNNPMFNLKKRVHGLRLVATDVEWSCGDGPEVRGPAEALLLAVGGRAGAFEDLEGEGLATLAERAGVAVSA